MAALALLNMGAGGVVPDGMGGWDGGNRDPIPPHSAALSWSSHSSFSAEEKDWIMFAFATWDLELVSMQLPRASGWSSNIQVRISTRDDVGCSTVGVSCILGETFCDDRGADAGTKYFICDQYRIVIYQNNVDRFAAARSLPRYDVWFPIIRHEIGHALGIDHSDGIMSQPAPINGYKGHVGQAPATACHVAMLGAFFVDPLASIWAYTAEPAVCQ